MKPTEAYSNISSAELVQTEHSDGSIQPSSSACSAQQQVTAASPHPSGELTRLLEEKSVTPLPSSSTQASQESMSLGGGETIGLLSFSEKELQALEALRHFQQVGTLQIQQVQICLSQLKFSMPEILSFLPKYTKYIKHQAPLITSALTKLSLINTTPPKGDDSSAQTDRNTEFDKQSEILISVFLPQITSLFSAFKFTQPQLLVLLDIVLGRKPVESLNEIDACKKPLAEIALFHLYSIGRIYSANVKTR